MKVDVFDTYVTCANGDAMHFDVLVPERSGQQVAQDYARRWLEELGVPVIGMELNRCRYCHSESAAPETEQMLARNGYVILQMEGCPASIG